MNGSCKECSHYNPDFIDEVCWHCVWPEIAREPLNFKPKPMTNADRIRAMTDEELANYLYELTIYGCPDHGARDCVPSCEACWLNWLKQEVGE